MIENVETERDEQFRIPNRKVSYPLKGIFNYLTDPDYMI